MRRVARHFRPTLDSFNFWVAVAYVGLVAVVVALFFINQQTSRNVRRTAADEAATAGRISANATSQFNACVESIPVLRKINDFIGGERIVRNVLVENARANLAVTPTDSTMYRTRTANLHRLEAAKKAAYQVKFPVPTRDSCKALRASLLRQDP